MSSFGDTELNLSGKGRNHLDFDYYLSTSLAPSWKDGSGSRISPDSPSALETRKESWGVMDMGQSTQQYLAQSTHIPKAAWLSVSTCPLLSVCPWHLGSALLTWPLLGDHPAKFSLPKTPRVLVAGPIPFGLSENTISFPNHGVLLMKGQRCSLFNTVFKSMHFQVPH